MIDEAKMESVMNETYPGLKLMQRDLRQRRFLQSYSVGDLLNDDRAIAGTFLARAPGYDVQYAILSNRLQRPPEGLGEARWAMAMLPKGGRFKVLDIYRAQGKTQIALLHLPKHEWQVFADISTNVDELLVDYVRKSFDVRLNSPAPAEFEGEAWGRLCQYAVGFSDMGAAIPL